MNVWENYFNHFFVLWTCVFSPNDSQRSNPLMNLGVKWDLWFIRVQLSPSRYKTYNYSRAGSLFNAKKLATFLPQLSALSVLFSI